MIVYVLDRRFMADAGGPPPHTVARGANDVSAWVHSEDRAVVFMRDEDLLSSMVRNIENAIIARRQGHRSLWKLVLCGHGNAGFIHMGSERLRESNVQSFSPLAPYMTPGGQGIELHSCFAASSAAPASLGPHRIRPVTNARGEVLNYTRGVDAGLSEGAGVRFLQALARTVQAQVIAGVDSQLFDPGYRMEGRRVVVQPSGRFTVSPAPRP
ncbi:MAG: hypothetical protein HY820_38535 [Acidobacteria bacterium]|nr:hypothetical protein [Acidobacteriota bacterium]